MNDYVLERRDGIGIFLQWGWGVDLLSDRIDDDLYNIISCQLDRFYHRQALRHLFVSSCPSYTNSTMVRNIAIAALLPAAWALPSSSVSKADLSTTIKLLIIEL